MSEIFDIPYKDLTPYGKKVFDVRNVINNVQVLLKLSGEGDEEVLQSLTSRHTPNEKLTLRMGVVTKAWGEVIFLLKNDHRVLNAVIQLRVLTMNPLSIYQAVLTQRLRTALLRDENVKDRIPVTGFTEIAKAVVYRENGRDTLGEGVMGRDLSVEYIGTDFPDGGIFDISPGVLFYGFPCMGIYETMSRMHVLETAGMYTLILESEADFDRYEAQCRRWGIVVVDRVMADEMSSLPSVHGSNIVSPMLIVKRHPNLFHDAPWASATASRPRGLGLGLPWAMKMTDGRTAERPLADDGFLDFFFTRIENGSREMLFLLPTSRSLGSLNRSLKVLWEETFGKTQTGALSLKRWGNNIYSVQIEDIVQWVQFRAMVRRVIMG